MKKKNVESSVLPQMCFMTQIHITSMCLLHLSQCSMQPGVQALIPLTELISYCTTNIEGKESIYFKVSILNCFESWDRPSGNVIEVNNLNFLQRKQVESLSQFSPL